VFIIEKDAILNNPLGEDVKMKPVPSMLDKRVHHALVWMGGFIYAVGGVLEDGRLTDRCEIFDPKRKKWKRIAAMKTARKNPSLCAFNDEVIYAFGGDDKINSGVDESVMLVTLNQSFVDDVDHVFNMKRKISKKKQRIFKENNVCDISMNKENYDLNSSMAYRETVLITNDIKDFPPISSEANNKRIRSFIERYSPEDNKWEVITPLNMKENINYDLVSSVQVNFNEILIFGGYEGENRTLNTKGLLYNVKKNAFTVFLNVVPLPVLRTHLPVVFRNNIYVIGDYPTQKQEEIRTLSVIEIGKKDVFVDCIEFLIL
jgi:hypothetical protein